jgi:hypothetical protein
MAFVGSSATQINKNLDVDESEDAVKTTSGILYGFIYSNVSAGTRYIKFYDATTANVTVGTTVPVLTFGVGTLDQGVVEFSRGIPFFTAITIAATTGVADNDTGAPGANDVIVTSLYE